MNEIKNDRQRFIDGVQTAVDLVGSTLGPAGNSVMEIGGGLHRFFRDGYRALELSQDTDPEIREAISRIRQVASNVVREAGDGTSTTTLLLGNAFVAIENALAAKGDTSRAAVSKAIEYIRDICLEKISEMSLPVTGSGNEVNMAALEAVATISAAGDALIGSQIARLVAAVGADGAIRVEQSFTGKVETDLVSGYVCDGTVFDQIAFNTKTGVAVDNCGVVAIADTLSDFDKVNGVIAKWIDGNGNRPLVFFVKDIEGTAKATLLNPRDKNGARFPIYLIQVGSHELLEDISFVTGATLFDKTKGKLLREVSEKNFGTAASINATLKTVSVVSDDNGKNSLEKATEYLETKLSGNFEQDDPLKERINRLHGKVGVIRVPSDTQTQGFYLHEVVDDSWRATMSALRDGVCPGGGMTLWRCAEEIDRITDAQKKNMEIGYGSEWVIAASSCAKALRSITQVNLQNAGIEDPVPDSIEGGMRTFRISLPAMMKGQGWSHGSITVGPALDLGVIDSVSSLRSAVNYAFTELALWVNSKYFIIQK